MQISLNNIRLYAYHGVMPDETRIGAWFTTDVSLQADCTQAVEHDDLAGTVNYAVVADIVHQEMATPSKLIEHVAGRIARHILQDLPQVKQVTVRVGKEHPPVSVECQSATVELTMER